MTERKLIIGDHPRKDERTEQGWRRVTECHASKCHEPATLKLWWFNNYSFKDRPAGGIDYCDEHASNIVNVNDGTGVRVVAEDVGGHGDHPRKDERTEALYDERTVPVPRYIIDHILACYFADPEIEADVETMCDLGRLVGFTLPPEFEDDEGRPTS